MKCALVLIFTIIVITFAAPVEDNATAQEIAKVHEKCQKDVPLDEEVMEKLRKHEKVETLPDNFAAHMLCMSKGVGTITEDGKVNKEKLKERLEAISGVTAEKVEQVLSKCVKEYETPEETALELGKCIATHTESHEHDHSHGHHAHH